MSHVIRCPKTSLCEWVDGPGRHPCPFCNKQHIAYESGAPPKERGCPNIIPDNFAKPYMDWSCGKMLHSRSQRRRVYAAKGLIESSIAEDRRKHGDGYARPGRAVSYAGQKDHKSSAERAGVRTSEGQRVV